MVRQSPKTYAMIIADMHRWHAAEWKRIRDSRLIAARVVVPGSERSACVRVARRANHEFVMHKRQVSL